MKESEFHNIVGGRARRDNRFVDQFDAPQIREMVTSVRKETGMNNKEIAEKIGVSSTTLSRAAGGRAGIRLNKDGHSTTEIVAYKLKSLLSEDEDYSI